jgi:outer membrane lipoprotein SlyB
VVAINDTSIRGGGGSGNGPMVGGLLGGLGGMAIGASGGRGIGGGLIGGLIGGIAGAIGGTIYDRHAGSGRGVEVVVQKDNGQTVTIAQRDDGDVQLGDRVQIYQDRSGVAKAVRDSGRQPDYQNQPPQTYSPSPSPSPQVYRQAGNYGGGNYGGSGNYGPPPQDYRQSPQDYGSGPQPAEYGQQQRYARPQSTERTNYQGGGYSGGSYPQPQNDPRYGTLQ